ncbi:unnamed protein product [Gongylonema pulchrum]|uniref:Innexin n=1 Tax=Gongylonema pulchrum TaxID=637853 RepID=A0A183DRU4_9BILA|nr:unnamed protein product [Gongylonema pulchrum]
MLGFPFIADFIQRVKPLEVTDSVDFMNYYCTTLLLAMAAFAISAKQYFGSPIQCWVPMEFRGGWEKYTEDYCFIQNSYYVSMEEEIPNELHKRNDQISYYRWVPVVQMLQALMFFAPNYFWNACCKQTAIQPQAIVKDAKKISMLRGENRKDEVCGLAEYISETVSIFSGRRFTRLPFPRLGKNATVLYLLTKLFYVMNIVAQFFLLNHFLEENFLLWGFQVALRFRTFTLFVLGDVISRREWQESSVFPRVIMCDFEDHRPKHILIVSVCEPHQTAYVYEESEIWLRSLQVRRLANIHRHSVQCVIMLNMINEKFYFFLWFWFLIVGFCTIVNFFYHLIVMTVPRARMRLVLWNIRKIEWEVSAFHF